MPGDPDGGFRGEDYVQVVPRRTPRVVGVAVMLLVLAVTAGFGYDHRRFDLSTGWTALPNGRVVSLNSAGFPGPRSLVVSGLATSSVRELPPILRHSTSVGPARRPGGLALSSNGWVLIRLGRLGKDTRGGQITEISPTGTMLGTFPLLDWRDGAAVGLTEAGQAVFRKGSTLMRLGPEGEGVPLLDLRHLGVTGDRKNLVDMAVAGDGRLAVLVGNVTGPAGYRLHVRRAGGSPGWVRRIDQADLFDDARGGPSPPGARPAVTFAGADVVLAGAAALLRIEDGGRVRTRISVHSAGRGRLRLAPSALAMMPDKQWAIGRDPLSILDAGGHVRRAGYGPCPVAGGIRPSCPAVFAGHRAPHPTDVLPPAGLPVMGAALLALIWAGRLGCVEAARTRLVVTLISAAWVTAWWAASLAWGELHGAAPLLLLGGACAAILAPALPTPDRGPLAAETGPAAASYQPWITERLTGHMPGTGPGRRLEVIPLPSRS